MRVAGKRFLVTGGSGFIGSALVRALVASGARVRVFDNMSRGSERRLGETAEQTEIVEGDVRDSAAVSTAVRGVDCVCHLAYVNGTEHFYTMPEVVLEVAVKGMTNVLDACLAHGVRDLVLASSSEVYQSPPLVPTDESAPLVVPDVLNPRYSYGAGKIVSESLAINYGRKHFDRVTIFRPHNVYGPDMGWEHVIPQFITRMRSLAGRAEGAIDVPIQGTGRETRAFVYVDDLVAGVVAVIERGAHLGIYHVGTQDEITIASLAAEIARQLALKVRIVPGELRAGSTVRRCPDITRIRRLGYEPRVTLTEGLALTIPWYLAHPAPATGESSPTEAAPRL